MADSNLEQKFYQLFYYNSNYNILICKSHGYAIRNIHLLNHLHALHKEINPASRIELYNIGKLLYTDRLIFPIQKIDFIPFLPIKTGYYKCIYNADNNIPCGYIFALLKHLKQHLKNEHGWINPRTRGRYNKTPINNSDPIIPLWEDNIYCQQFYNTGSGQRLFEVYNPNGTENPELSQNPPATIIAIGTQKLQTRLAEISADNNISNTNDISRLEPNFWLNRAGWPRHFGNFDKTLILSWLQLPDLEDTNYNTIRIILKCQKDLVYDAINISNSEIFPLSALFYINRKESGESSNEKPFNPRLLLSTIDKYLSYWNKIIIYLFNTWDLPQSNRPAYIPTKQQNKSYQKLISHISNWANSQDSDQDSNNSSSNESDLNSDISSEFRLKSDKNQLLAIKHRFLSFIIALFDHSLQDSEYASPIISASAALGLNDDYSWKEAKNYTGILSGIITLIRLIVLYYSDYLNKQDKSRYSQSDPDKIKSVLKYTRIFTDKLGFLSGSQNQPTPYDYLYKLRTYGFKIRYNLTEIGAINWDDNELIFDDIRLNLSILREFIHSLAADAQKMLYFNLLFIDTEHYSELPALDLNKLVDNTANSEPGWCFLQDRRNTELYQIDNDRWLYKRILGYTNIANRFIRDYQPENSDFQWNTDYLSEYFNYIRQYKDLLLVLAHLTSGAPARGTELLSIRYYNTVFGGLRNLFLEKGLIALVPTYHKGANLSAKPKVVHRYLPASISVLFVYYLWLVIPFEYNISVLSAENPQKVEKSAFLWPEKTRPRGPSQSSPIKKRARISEPSKADSDELSELNSSITDLSLPFWTRYNSWTAGQFSQLILRFFRAKIGLNVGLLKWRHILIAIIRKYAPNAQKALINTNSQFDSDNSDNSDSDNHISDLQAGHSSRIGENIYGRDISELAGATESKRIQFYQLSLWLHRFYLFETALSDSAKIHQRTLKYRAQKWKIWQQIDLKSEFRRYFGSDSNFQSLQESGLKMILSGTSPIIIIMGTGRGKSLFFLLPTLISRNLGSDSIIILIVPLISLRSDLIRRCQELNIRADIWDSNNTALNPEILLITPESAVSTRFKEFLRRQKYQNRLERIYIDECHILLDSKPDFRPKIGRLSELLAFETQLIYLTATLPPQNEPEWFSLAGFNSNNAKLLREATVRTNIRYTVRNFDSKNFLEQLSQLIQIKSDFYPPNSQIIVYCGTIQLTKQIGRVLNCPVYYSKIENSDKNGILSAFQANKIPVIAATSALGLGLDLPTIRVIIHIDILGGIRDYSQESGRAGRNGDISEAILIRKNPNKPFSDPDLNRYTTTDICRRIILDSIIDGRLDRVQCEDNEQKCDLCEARINSRLLKSPPVVLPIIPNSNISERLLTEPDESEIAEYRQVEQQKRYLQLEYQKNQAQNTINLTELIRKLDQWPRVCIECGFKHNPDKPAVLNPDQKCFIGTTVQNYQKIVEYEKYSGCYHCGLPQEICQRWDLIRNRQFKRVPGKTCQYPLVLYEFLARIQAEKADISEKWLSELYRNRNIYPRNPQQLLAILGKKTRGYNIEINELCRCFWELYSILD